MRNCSMAEPFRWPVRVYWEDTDAGGVVYHAQYLAFMERARSEWLRSRGIHQDRMRADEDLVFVVRAMEIDFRAPARLDDQLEVSVRLLECRGASLVLAQK
ncbi:MAG: tol-pal system-associated acyl-CoA thioesterase, partial [Lysobacteraceae bacterium]